MKCPKCGYITFDYAKTCPKCNKDIVTERERLNLPAFAPAPLSLLDTLIARAIRPDIDTEIQEENSLKDLPFRDSVEELSLDIEDFTFESPVTPPHQIEKANGYEFLLEPDFLSPSEPSEGEEETFSIDLDDISADKIEVANQQGFSEEGVNEIKLDLEELASMVEELAGEENAGYTESDITAEKTQAVSPSAEAPADDNNDSENRGFLELDLDLDKGDEKSS